MFCRPVKSGWKPEPSSRIDAILPCTRNEPEVGAVTPARIFSKVLLPAPFSPTTASPSPGGMVKPTPLRAGNSRWRGRPETSSNSRSQGVAYTR